MKIQGHRCGQAMAAARMKKEEDAEPQVLELRLRNVVD